MSFVFSLVGLFLILLCLVGCFHAFFWDGGWFRLNNVRSWASPFECGFSGSSLSETYFSFTYFILLVFFVVFDLEISLLLNMPFQGLMFKNFPFYVFFLVILSVGYSLELSSGYARWGL